MAKPHPPFSFTQPHSPILPTKLSTIIHNHHSTTMDLQTTLLACLCGTIDKPTHPFNHTYTPITEKPPLHPLPSPTLHDDNDDNDLTQQILALLLSAPTPTPPTTNLTPLITSQTPITPQSWTSALAERILHALEETLKGEHETWGPALTDAYARAEELVKEELAELWAYAQAHPLEVAAEVVLTVLALGVLGRLVPGFVRVLGFAREGPVAGKFWCAFKGAPSSSFLCRFSLSLFRYCFPLPLFLFFPALVSAFCLLFSFSPLAFPPSALP